MASVDETTREESAPECAHRSGATPQDAQEGEKMMEEDGVEGAATSMVIKPCVCVECR